jgi:uncharacterized RDD family membrane protein YckC
MVMPDWSAPKSAPTVKFAAQPLSSQNALYARPVDRLAAVIVDLFVILAPLFLLASAPLKKWMTLSFLVGSEADFAFNIAGMIGLGVLIVVAYQTIFHHFFKATLGKMLFDLRVVPMFPDHEVGLWDCFIRSWLWVFEVFALGLPWLAVYSNPYRRPMHDRVCDTIVVTRGINGVGTPAVLEKGLVRAVFVGFLTFSTLIVLSQIYGNLEKIKSEAALSALLEHDDGACEVVNKNISDEEAEKEHGRLTLAMTLYAAGLSDRSCLEAEVERELVNQVPVGSVTYLAQAFVYADDAEVSNSYLDEVCESSPGTVECAMSSVVSRWSSEDWEGVESALNEAPHGSGYLEVWGVRHFMKQARYEKALELLNSLVQTKYLSEFSLVQRVKGLFNSYREPEAEAALLQAVSVLPDEEGQDLSYWMCAQQLQNGCKALERAACQPVKENASTGEKINFQQPHEALARVLALECNGKGEIDYLSYAESANDDNWRIFFRANLKRQREDRSASAALFSEILLSPDSPDLLKIEAARRLAQFADRPQIEELFDYWRALESKEAWVKTGNILFKRLAELQYDRLALKVARSLMNGEAMSPQAFAVLSDMIDSPPENIRQPASVKNKDNLKDLLESIEEGK